MREGGRLGIKNIETVSGEVEKRNSIEREMGGEEEVESKPEAVKSHVAVRCAKAALLLASLKASLNRYPSVPPLNHQDEEEKEMMAREIRFLKVELEREKLRSRKIRVCGLTEIVLEVLVVFSASTLLLMLALGAGTS